MSLTLVTSFARSQSLDINIKRGTDLNFTFNTIRQYNNGIILAGATEITVESTAQWDLYVGAQTNVAGRWDVLNPYSSSGSDNVPVSILELRASSPGGTSQQMAFFQLQDNSSPIFLIGSAADDPLTANGVGANAPGDPVTNAFTHRFRIDYKLTPTMGYTPGVYSLTVVFTLAEDL
ncbi:hypothetical protein ACV07N_08365 [Roseivirga echinicomitans]